MTASKVLFDTWAWWEVLQGSEKGAALERRYLDASGIHVVTSAITLGELAAKLASQGPERRSLLAINSVHNAQRGRRGPRRPCGGRWSSSCAIAQTFPLSEFGECHRPGDRSTDGARLISADKAFNGELDVSTG